MQIPFSQKKRFIELIINDKTSLLESVSVLLKCRHYQFDGNVVMERSIGNRLVLLKLISSFRKADEA